MLLPSVLGFWFIVIGSLVGLLAYKQIRDAGEQSVNTDNAIWFEMIWFCRGVAFSGAVLIALSLLGIV